MFNEQHPNVTVNVEYLPWNGMDKKQFVSRQAGAGPDILNQAITWTRPFAEAGLLYDVTHRIESDIDTQDFFPAAMERVGFDGRRRGVPYQIGTVAFVCNKDMFEAAGLALDRPPATRAELGEYAKALTRDTDGDGRIDQFGFGVVAGKPRASDV